MIIIKILSTCRVLNMDVSIIVCSYNRCESLRSVLKDLIMMEEPLNVSYEVLVVDNNSTDETKSVVEAAIKEKPSLFKYIFEPKQGKSFALNTGVTSAQGNIMAFTDDDVQIDRNWLVGIISCFDCYDCAGVGGRIMPVWNSKKPRWYDEGHPFGPGGGIVKLDFGEYPCELNKPVWGANMAFRREVFDKYGLFKEDLGPNPNNLIRGEDKEFCLRLICGKEKIIYAPKALVYHPVEEKRVTKKYMELWWFNEGRARQRSNPIDVTKSICYFGVPKYFFRCFLNAAVKWLFCINSQRRFIYKLQVYAIAGEIAEVYYQRNA